MARVVIQELVPVWGTVTVSVSGIHRHSVQQVSSQAISA